MKTTLAVPPVHEGRETPRREIIQSETAPFGIFQSLTFPSFSSRPGTLAMKKSFESDSLQTRTVAPIKATLNRSEYLSEGETVTPPLNAEELVGEAAVVDEAEGPAVVFALSNLALI